MGAIAAIVGLALASRVIYGSGFDSYDPMWSLIWGREMTHGRLPDLTAVGTAPTSHPLANVVGAVASLFGQGGPAVLSLLSFLSLGLLGWAGFRLGRALFGVAVGVCAATLFVTRPPVVDETLQALVDIPFLALVVWAAALEAERPRRGLPVLGLLGLAGLLRPEAWLLSAAYVGYLWLGPSPRELARWTAAAAAAPLAWLGFDLVVTGDPLHSLHGTRELAGLLGRPRGADTALLKVPSYLEYLIAEPLLWAGLVGVMLGLGFLFRRSVLPAGILALGLASFLALGVAGLPLLYRYVFVPGLMLALFAGVAVLGWLSLPGGRERRIWQLAALPASALVIGLWLPGEVDRLQRASDRAAAIAHTQEAQRALVQAPATRALLRRCLPIYLRSLLQRPIIAYRLNVPPERVSSGRTSPRRGSAVVPATTPPPTARYRRRAANVDWAVYSSCGTTASLVLSG